MCIRDRQQVFQEQESLVMGDCGKLVQSDSPLLSGPPNLMISINTESASKLTVLSITQWVPEDSTKFKLSPKTAICSFRHRVLSIVRRLVRQTPRLVVTLYR